MIPIVTLAVARHYIALALFAFNLWLYFSRFRIAVVLTGVIFLLATFNLLAFFPAIGWQRFSFSIGSLEISTPAMQWQPLLLLILYLAINTMFLFDVYLDYKENK
jgi:hypothetical protein